MSKALFLIGLAAVIALAGCGGSSTKTTTQQGGTSNTVNTPITASLGGTITAPVTGGGSIGVSIPAGALAANTTISVTPVTTAPLPLSVSSAFIIGVKLEPDGTQFSSPVTLTLPLASAKAVGSKLLVLLVSGGSYSAAGVATVQAGGTTATITVTHFSTYVLTGTYQISATATNGPGMGFVFGSGAEFDGAPVDFYFVGSGPSVQPNHSPAKTTTALYPGIIQASAGGYAMDPITVQVGTTILFQGQMTNDQGSYYKMVVTDVSSSALTFLYEKITAPPALGQWSLGSAGAMSFMASTSGPGYIVDVYDSQGGALVKMMNGTLSGTTLTGTWVHTDTSAGGAFTLNFNAAFTQFTGVFSGTESGSWTGTLNSQ